MRVDAGSGADGGTVVVPAQGVPARTRAAVDARRLRVVDATCPLVAAGHAELRRFAADGDAVVVIGRRGHAALAAFAGQTPERPLLVETVADVAGLPDDGRPMSYVVQTGLPIEDVLPVIAALRTRFPGIRGTHPDLFCYAASDRAATVRSVAVASDLVLVLGDRTSPEATHAVASVRFGTPSVRLVRDLGHIQSSWLTDASTIAVVATSSAPEDLPGATVDALSGLGPLSVVHRKVRSEALTVEQVPDVQHDRILSGRAPDSGRSSG